MVLGAFIAANREEIIARCRGLRARSSPEAGGGDGIAIFMDQLVDALRRGVGSTPAIGSSAIRRGHAVLLKGFTVSQVVHDYDDICDAITALAAEQGTPITTGECCALSRCLDDAIADAVTEYAREHDHRASDAAAARGNEELGFFAHELRNLVHTAMLSFGVLRTGNVGVAGSTANVLHRSLLGLHALIERSLAEIRLTAGAQNQERIVVSTFVDELGAAAVLDAEARGLRFTALPVADGIAVDGDRQMLAAVVHNLLQNAFKFTRPATTITLRVSCSPDRVRIEIEDECGGLPTADPDELFGSFEQRSADRSGLGLGLAFSRRAVAANRGRIYARDIPGLGCVFTVDLPRVALGVPSGTACPTVVL